MSLEREDIPEVIQSIREGTDLFYQQRIHEAMMQYDMMLSKMLSLVDFFFEKHKENPDFQLDEEKIQQNFNEILSAMEQKDYTLMADIISYEFLDYMEELYRTA